MPSGWTAWLVILSLGAPGVAFAEPSATDLALAKRLFAEATVAESAERWAEVREKLSRVLEIKETAGVRFHLALAEEKLGVLLAAEGDYRRALDLAPTMPAADRGSVVSLGTEALARIQTRVPTVTPTIATKVAGLTVMLDGHAVADASLGTPIRHELGEARVSASAPGKKAFERAVILLPGDHATMEIMMEDEARAATVAPLAAPASSAPASAEQAPVARSKVGAWITAGGAAVLAGGSVYFLLHRASLVNDTDTVCAEPLTICDRDARDSRAKSYLTYGLIAAGGAVVSAGVSVYLFTRGSDSPMSASIGPGSIQLHGSFLGKCCPHERDATRNSAVRLIAFDRYRLRGSP